MKKIMFNDKYGLTDAVLNGKKIMTRRAIPCKVCQDVLTPIRYNGSDVSHNSMAMKHAHYKVGEVVAIAQSYHSLNKMGFIAPEWCEHMCEDSAGYENKMFVRADLMPHRIKITDIKVERLQDIRDEDCLREGIADLMPEYKKQHGIVESHYCFGESFKFQTPRAAFAALIDRISGRGTWQSNPWVFVYSFELIK